MANFTTLGEIYANYYLMAIEKGNSGAMYNMGLYYQDVEKDYDQMKRYYLMAIENNNTSTINRAIHNNYYYCELIKWAILSKKIRRERNYMSDKFGHRETSRVGSKRIGGPALSE